MELYYIMEQIEPPEQENHIPSSPLENLLIMVKSTPRALAASTVYALSYAPALAGFSFLGNDLVEQALRVRTPSLAEYSGDILLFSLGT